MRDVYILGIQRFFPTGEVPRLKATRYFHIILKVITTAATFALSGGRGKKMFQRPDSKNEIQFRSREEK